MKLRAMTDARHGARTGTSGHRHVYGPVPSRRLGYSLGVDILPFKTCTLNCVYCQLGASPKTRLRSGDFVPVGAVIDEIKAAVASGKRIDTITFSGSGEPTLNRSLGRLIRGIKSFTAIPVTVLTNGTLLYRPEVREALAAADVVVPSFDAATPALFRRVNRPHRGLGFERMLEGLRRFRREFRGRIWLEVMLLKGVNDSPAHLRRLKKIVDEIRPDRVDLTTPVRPPAESWAAPLSQGELEAIRRDIGPLASATKEFSRAPQALKTDDIAAAVLAVTRRRPVTLPDLARSLGRPAEEIQGALLPLVASGRIRRVTHGRRTFYEAAFN